MSFVEIDDTGDRCCFDAAMNGNLDVMNRACATNVVEDDDFFTWNSITCTRRFDRTTYYYTSSDTTFTLNLNTHRDICIEEVVGREQCCHAKLNGNGNGLEDACNSAEEEDQPLIPSVPIVNPVIPSEPIIGGD